MMCEEKQCENCELFGTEENPVTYAPNPYTQEMDDDDTCYWMCADCRYESASDI